MSWSCWSHITDTARVPLIFLVIEEVNHCSYLPENKYLIYWLVKKSVFLPCFCIHIYGKEELLISLMRWSL